MNPLPAGAVSAATITALYERQERERAARLAIIRQELAAPCHQERAS